MAQRIIPGPVADDDDDIVVALETARVSEERRDVEAAIRWMGRAIEAAQRQGRDERIKELSRCIVQLGGTVPSFQSRPAAPHLLAEAHDDFADETIVESTFEIATKQGSDLVVPSATPVAPLSTQTKAVHYLAARVGVKKVLGGRYEVRTLGEGEKLDSGEQEALLVPVRPGVKF